MTEDAPPPPASRASAETQRFVARRQEARRAAAADRARAAAEGRGEPDPDDASRKTFLLGFLVVAALCLIGWLIIQQLRCNPLFSDAAFSRACSRTLK